MTRDYMIGSARDPKRANRLTRTRIESAVRQTLHTGGVGRMTAVEAASDLVIDYLTKGRSETLKLVRGLVGNEIADLLEPLRQTDLEDRRE